MGTLFLKSALIEKEKHVLKYLFDVYMIQVVNHSITFI